MPNATQNRGIVFDNGSYSFSESGLLVTTDHKRVWEIDLPALPAGNTGTIVVNGGAVVTLASGHNIVDGNAVDAYWLDGTTPKHRYDLSAAVVVNAVTLTDGADAGGDALQHDKTVTLCRRVAIADLPITGANLEWLAMVYSNPSDTGAKASLDIHDSGGLELQNDLVHFSTLGGCSVVYNVAGGDANPIDGDVITDGFASHDSASAAKLYVLALIDSTP